MASNVRSASDSLASLLENSLRALLVNLIDPTIGTFDRWTDVPFLKCMNVGFESVTLVVWVDLQRSTDEFSVTCHVVWSQD